MNSTWWWSWPGPLAWCLDGVALLGVVIIGSTWGIRPLLTTLSVVGVVLCGSLLARGRPRVAGSIAVGVGSVSTLVGVAVGLQFVVSGSLSARSLAGTAALFAGVMLIAIGGASVTRGFGATRRLAILCTMLASIVILAGIVAPGLVDTNVPRLRSGPDNPTDRGLAYQGVTMHTSDGLTLVGWYVPSRNRAAVILRHGSHANKTSELDHLAVLAEAGFGVLVPDGRGRGDSQGQAMDLGWYGDLDISAAVDTLARRPDVDPTRIGIVGISLGGMEAIGAAAADSRIRAVVVEGVTRRSDRDLVWLPEAYAQRGVLLLELNRLQFGITSLLSEVPRPESLADSVARTQGTSFLLVTADNSDEVWAADTIRRRAPDRVRIWTVRGAGHADGLDTAPKAWSDTVNGFLSNALLDGR